MANSAFDHTAAITVPGSSTNTAIVTWTGTGADTFGNSTILVGSTTMGLAADTDLLTFGNGTLAITGAITGVTALTASGAVTGGTLAGTVSTATQGSITSAANLATVGTITTGTWNGTAVITTYGGTGLASHTAGDMLYYASGTTLTRIAKGTADQVLTMNDGATAPGWEDAAGGSRSVAGDTDNGIITWVTSDNTFAAEQYLTFSGNNMVLQSTSGGSGQSSLYIETYKSTASGWHGGQLVLRLSMNNTIGSHTVIQADHTLGNIDFEGSDGSAFYRSARILTDAGENWSGSAKGSRMKFFTTSNGATSFTERLRIETDGDVNVKSGNLVIGTAGKGIDFSAQTPTSASSTSTTYEILDHYEEGTFTPELRGASVTGSIDYVSRMGRFTRVGNRVHVHIWLNVDTSSGASGQAMIYGLPFAVVDVADAVQTLAVGRAEGLSLGNASESIACAINRNTSHIEFRVWDRTSGMGDLPIGEFGTGQCSIAGSYECA